jgi:4-amino-4-deoxy-L-arabinose transferase-like glycosyltransferase
MLATAPSSQPAAFRSSSESGWHSRALLFLGALWVVLYFAACFSPPILDDADGTHANAARQILLSHDWVTLRVNNVRYLEKAALPYWIVAICFRLFGLNAFAAHLPQALAVLALALLGFRWAREAYGERAAFYTGLFTLTSAGIFLFTRVLIPDVLLSLLLALTLYALLKSLERSPRWQSQTSGTLPAPKTHHSLSQDGKPHLVAASLYPYILWTALALAVMAKGLVALVFFFGAAGFYLALTGDYRQWRRLKPIPGIALFLVIAAPWHILAGLRNTGGMGGHGFFWFYFINEHVLRFLGRRAPRDYNKLPGYLYWGLHLVWLFPWALFAPVLALTAWRRWKSFAARNPRQVHRAIAGIYVAGGIVTLSLLGPHHKTWAASGILVLILWIISSRRLPDEQERNTLLPRRLTFRQQTTVLLTIFSAFVLLFFSLSTNQEYYTLPAYIPILMLLAAAVAKAEQTAPLFTRKTPSWQSAAHRSGLTVCFGVAHAAFTILGLLIAAALSYGLWISRKLPAPSDIGALLAHRGVGDYTLSMSSLFDLTGSSFAALRLPAALALATFAIGPIVAWRLRVHRRHLAATTAIALTSATFLIAAHIALGRFAPMLSSEDMAQTILTLEHTGQIAPNPDVLLFGDQAYGSSIGFYLNRPLDKPVRLVDGRSSSMLFGSYFPDAQAQHLFLTPAELTAEWGQGPRKILFVPIDRRTDAEQLLAPYHPILLKETSGKLLLTDRPLHP